MTLDAARARPCPRAGCSSWAQLATADAIVLEAHIWTCGSGHRGPRILGHGYDVR